MFESLNEFVLSTIVVLSGGVVAVLVGRWLGQRSPMIAFLYAWHTALGYVFSSYVLINGGDAWDYYEHARFDYVRPNIGTEFVTWATSIPVRLGLTYWPLSFFYNAIGAVGLLFFYSALRETTQNTKSTFAVLLALLCTLLPSLSFWTSGIGKDSVALLSVGIFLWSSLAFAKRQIAAVIAVLIMLAVRPHIAALMVLSVASGTIFVKDLRGATKFGMGAIATAAAAFAVPLALLYSGSTRFLTIGEYISDRQGQNMEGGSSIDIAGMNPLSRLFSFLCRPLPNEASGLAQVATSMENLILVLVTAVGLIAIYRAGAVKIFRTYSISLLYGLGCLGLLSQVTANLGIAARQKWMAVPALMLVFVGAWTAMKKGAAPNRSQFRELSGAPQAAR